MPLSFCLLFSNVSECFYFKCTIVMVNYQNLTILGSQLLPFIAEKSCTRILLLSIKSTTINHTLTEIPRTDPDGE